MRGEMLTLSERGDTWHLDVHIKQMPCWPEKQTAVINIQTKLQSSD